MAIDGAAKIRRRRMRSFQGWGRRRLNCLTTYVGAKTVDEFIMQGVKSVLSPVVPVCVYASLFHDACANASPSWTEGSGRGTTLLLYFAFALVHDSRGIEIVNFITAAALSAGTLMASAAVVLRTA